MKKTEGDKPDRKPKRRRRTSVTVGHKTVDGKRVPIRKYPSAPSLEKLQTKKQELRRIYGAGGPGDLADVMMSEYSVKVLDGLSGKVTDNTWSVYSNHVRRYINPILGLMQVRSIVSSDVKLWAAKMSKVISRKTRLPLAINTRRTALDFLKQIFNQAIEDHIRLDNPAESVEMTVDIEPKRRALTLEESAAAVAFIAAHPRSDEARMVAMHYYTSCRRGEAFGLQWKHLDFQARTIKICQQMKYVKGGGGEISPRLKSKRSYRDIPMPQELYDVMYPLRGLPGAYVFQDGKGHYKPNAVEELWKAVVESCPALAELTPHYFRHNYATMMYKAGVPVKEAARIMGETVRVMLNTYVHIEQELGGFSPDVKDKLNGMFKTSVAKVLPSDGTGNAAK